MYIIKVILLLVVLLSGCADMGIQNPFTHDPLTGGQNASASLLLETNLPVGMQRYASHGYSTTGPQGQRHGLETFRGNVDTNAAAMTMFNGLTSAGWQLRMQNHKGDRSVYIYEKGNDIALLVFHRQGILTVMEIWRSSRLEDGTSLVRPSDDSQTPSLAGEEYGPLDKTNERSGAQGKVETWGNNSNLEEREL